MQPDQSTTLLLCLGAGTYTCTGGSMSTPSYKTLLEAVRLALGASFWDVSSTTSRPPASRGGCSSAGPLAAHVGSAAYAS